MPQRAMPSSELWIPILAALAAVLALLLVRARSEFASVLGSLEDRQRAAEAEARESFERWKHAHETAIRGDAVRRSQAVVSGKAMEQLVPFLPEFPFDPRDVRFLGSPVDLVVFDGMTAGELREIVLVEVKTGEGAALSPRERRVRDAVNDHRVRFRELRLPGPEDELATSYYVPLHDLGGGDSGQLEVLPAESRLRHWVDWSEPPVDYALADASFPRLDGRPCLKLTPEGELLVLELGGGQRLEVDREAGRLAIEGRSYRLDDGRLGSVRGASVLKLEGGR